MLIIHEYSHCIIRLAHDDFTYFTPTSSQEDKVEQKEEEIKESDNLLINEGLFDRE
jgi:hypothetical protein